MVVGRNVATTVEFLGDSEGHEAGFLYQFRVVLDNSSAVDPAQRVDVDEPATRATQATCASPTAAPSPAPPDPIEQLFVIEPRCARTSA
jgi:hypothetical protein